MEAMYLDNAATTRVAPEVAAEVAACMDIDFGNPASAHHLGVTAEQRVADARMHLLAALGDRDGRAGDVYWTSGGTEADAMGIIGAARARMRGWPAGYADRQMDGRAHILCSAIEHAAVRESAALLAPEGARVELVPVTPAGVVEVERVVDALAEDTAVVAIMLVNNEIGTVQPVAEIARAVKDKRPDVHIHCDAVQALGKLALDVGALGADSVALAAHKLHGPKGVGALWLRKGARMMPLWAGGGQQEGLRSGTLNVPGIAGMGAAARLAHADLAEQQAAWRALGERLVALLRDAGVRFRINGDGAERAPHIVSLAFAGIAADTLLHVLESRGVLVSAGSACAERSSKPSPVLTAIGVGRDHGTLRLSFGRYTTMAEVERAAGIIIEAAAEL